jgi:superoxide dismutase, Cu-Zn family
MMATRALAPLALALASCTTTPTATPPHLATAQLIDRTGAPAGSAALAADATGLVLQVTAAGLAPGVHGMHLHAIGRCETPDFASAGGHLNPHGRQHGSANPQGKHLGDLPNITAGPDGRATAAVPITGDWSEHAAAIFDGDGTALVIHAGADDYRTDPSGNSGERVACGVFRRP